MTLIRNLPALVTVSGTDIIPMEDVSEQITKKMTVNQLTAYIITQLTGGGGGVLIDLDSQGPIPITLGGFTAGEAGVYTADEYGNKLLRPYFAPAVTSLTNAGLIKTFEVGEALPNGTQAVAYTISNPGQIKSQPPNVGIPSTNIAGATIPVNPVLLAASSSFNIVIPSAFFLSAPGSRTISLQGTNSNDGTFSGTATIPWLYKQFYGPVAAAASDSAGVRALPSNRFTNAGNVFLLNTGSTNRIFQLWVPTGQSLSNVTDIDALNANLTSQYIPTALSVNDANGNPVTGTLYTMTQAVPYSVSHRHQLQIV